MAIKHKFKRGDICAIVRSSDNHLRQFIGSTIVIGEMYPCYGSDVGYYLNWVNKNNSANCLFGYVYESEIELLNKPKNKELNLSDINL